MKNLNVMELPVNNYLKSRDEIEAEFRYAAAADRIALIEKDIPSATYGRIMKISEEGSSFRLVSLELTGPLEENY